LETTHNIKKSKKSKVFLALSIYFYLVMLSIVLGITGAYYFGNFYPFFIFVGFFANIVSVILIYFYTHTFYTPKNHVKEVGLIKERKNFFSIFIFPFLFNSIFIIIFIIPFFLFFHRIDFHRIVQVFLVSILVIGPSIIFDYLFIRTAHKKSVEIKNLRP